MAAELERLLDFNQPLDVPMLDQVRPRPAQYLCWSCYLLVCLVVLGSALALRWVAAPDM
jgi:hypothetical protein